jgi:hypothetical protein
MAKFLVITHPKEPISDSAYGRLAKRVEYWKQIHDARRAEVYSVVGRKGYAILIDVDSHDELIDILVKSPMGQDEEHDVYALGTVEAEAETAQAVRFADRV